MNNHIKSIFKIIKNDLRNILKLRALFSEKPDGSLVSQGDILVQNIIISYLKEFIPNYVLISEEIANHECQRYEPLGSYVVLDPIDGTENFVSGLREWGVGISIYSYGKHQASGICLPELCDQLVTGDSSPSYKSRIIGLSSSLTKADLAAQPDGFEYRVIGCSMYNCLAAIRGSYKQFENVKGVNSWDILPGLNLALEHGCKTYVDGKPYCGQLLFPPRKYKINISRRICNE
jgi:myo-inositol-1(or 4)-monophosphatase